MIIITSITSVLTSVTQGSTIRNNHGLPPCVFLLKEAPPSVHLRVSELHVLSRTGHT